MVDDGEARGITRQAHPISWSSIGVWDDAASEADHHALSRRPLRYPDRTCWSVLEYPDRLRGCRHRQPHGERNLGVRGRFRACEVPPRRPEEALRADRSCAECWRASSSHRSRTAPAIRFRSALACSIPECRCSMQSVTVEIAGTWRRSRQLPDRLKQTCEPRDPELLPSVGRAPWAGQDPIFIERLAAAGVASSAGGGDPIPRHGTGFDRGALPTNAASMACDA